MKSAQYFVPSTVHHLIVARVPHHPSPPPPVNEMIEDFEEKLAMVEQKHQDLIQEKRRIEQDRVAVADALKEYRAKVRLDANLAHEEDPINCDPK